MGSWEARNAEWVKKLGLESREREVPDTGVVLDMEEGVVYAPGELPTIEIAPGVRATVSWGKGTLLELLEMEAGAAYPQQEMQGEFIGVMQQGSAICEVDGEEMELGADGLLYLTAGMKRSLRAGPDGLKALEIFSPVRPDHLALAGTVLPEGADGSFPDQGIERASLEAGRAYRFGDVQRIPIVLPGMDAANPTAHTRLIWGKNFMLSFVHMAANSTFPMHIHPEDQLMMIMDGAMEEGIIDEWLPMSGDRKDIILQPGGMAHAAKLSPQGAHVLDMFWPVRPDYMALAPVSASDARDA